MISVTAEYKEKLARIFRDNELKKQLLKGFTDSKYIVEGFYKKELPVNSSLARNRVVSENLSEGFFTTTIAKSDNGEPYPLYLYGGMGKYKGQPDGGYTTGETRLHDYSEKTLIMFKAMAKRGYRFNVRPNKFSDRAEAKAKDPVVRTFINLVDKLSNGTS